MIPIFVKGIILNNISEHSTFNVGRRAQGAIHRWISMSNFPTPGLNNKTGYIWRHGYTYVHTCIVLLICPEKEETRLGATTGAPYENALF